MTHISPPLLSTLGLTVTIAGKTLCQDWALALNQGEIWGILGGNGAGKTTLLHTLAGLRAADNGQVLLQGIPLEQLKSRQRAQQLGFLLQDDSTAFPATVLETALQGRHPHLGPFAWESQSDENLAHNALQRVELDDFCQRNIDQLSGGERQRLKIATLMVQQPKIWLLDEPANHLDLHHQVSLLQQLLADVKQQSGCLLMSLHDLNLAQRFCDHLILLFPEGPMIGTKEELLTEERLEQLYQHPIRRLETEAGPVFIPA
ncbi:ABC transporter ATP-binding protein [Oceanospirillum maris]|uniref:ABC transporter ATP-binding protein n=1 Tax=Oceanospirillum maris TaxID=64977 RepID=UPI000417414A|nr:ABC transporter ATP-binding protein [Oceanospirillum maris]